MLCENIATNLQETVTVIRIGLLYLLGLNGFNYPLYLLTYGLSIMTLVDHGNMLEMA